VAGGAAAPQIGAIRWGCVSNRGRAWVICSGYSSGFPAPPLYIDILSGFGPGDNLPAMTTRGIVRVSFPGSAGSPAIHPASPAL